MSREHFSILIFPNEMLGVGGLHKQVNAFWATAKFLSNSPAPGNMEGLSWSSFQQGHQEQVSLNLIISMMLFVSLNEPGILLMCVQDGLYLSLLERPRRTLFLGCK